MGIMASTTLGKASPALPLIRDEFGLGLVAGGLVVSLCNAVAALLGLMAGLLADRVGRRRMMLGGLLILGLAGVFGASAGSAWQLLAWRALEGFGFVAVVVIGGALIAEAAGNALQRVALGIWGAYVSIGMGAMVLLAPLAIGAGGWRLLWLAGGAVTAAYALFAFAMTRRIGAPAPRTTPVMADLGAVAGSPASWLLGACMMLYTFQWFGVLGWLPTFLIEQRGMTLGTASLVTGLAVLINLFGNIGSGWLLHRGWPRWLLMAGAGGCMAAAHLLMATESLPGGLRLAAAFGFSVLGGFLPGAVLAGAPVFAPTPRLIGSVNGMLMQGSNIGTVSGPPLIGMIVAQVGDWSAVGPVLAAASGAIILLAFYVRGLERGLASRSMQK